MNITREKIGPLTLVTVITEREIKITGAYMEDFVPEMQAALGATLSRDPGSIESRLKKIFGSKKISQRILDVYFKKYGHNSIGDMGNLIFSIEGSSMRGAFNLLEDQLFNGQEASTRYLDFGKMGYLPVSEKVDEHSKECMNIYSEVLESEMKKNTEVLGMLTKDAEPKAFDIAGSYLPISARTNVFWSGSIRTYIKKIRELRSMGREEKEIGEAMSIIFDEICPNSQRDVGEDYLKDEISFKKSMNELLMNESLVLFGKKPAEIVSFNGFNTAWFKSVTATHEKIHHISNLAMFGSISSSFDFDFRSARDIHRHRAFHVNTVVNWKPEGLETFYYNQISSKVVRGKVLRLEGQLMKLFKEEGDNSIYGMPMAMKFKYIMSGPLNAWLYFLDLRSGPKVHPRVIKLTQNIGEIFEEELGLTDVYQRGNADYGLRSSDANKV
ncbi:MAG TPA: hypothetical protein EYG72_02485 [Candidatus Pacebacteria bacterium]|nr:hypothetical protein [Candidatus Paceibacterota bacterium]